MTRNRDFFAMPIQAGGRTAHGYGNAPCAPVPRRSRASTALWIIAGVLFWTPFIGAMLS